MNKQINTKLAEDEFYHGTNTYSAFMIMAEGFKFNSNFALWGKNGTFGSAIYLTKSFEAASGFGMCILKCRVKEGIRLLHLTEDYDNKIINYLTKKFNKTILNGNITKTLPSNKHLTNKELISLLNYRYEKLIIKKKWTPEISHKWNSAVSSFRQQLRYNKYDGIGETQTEIGLSIFNPSYVEPLEIAFIRSNTKFINFDKKIFIKNLQEEIKDSNEYLSKADCQRFKELFDKYTS